MLIICLGLDNRNNIEPVGCIAKILAKSVSCNNSLFNVIFLACSINTSDIAVPTLLNLLVVNTSCDLLS